MTEDKRDTRWAVDVDEVAFFELMINQIASYPD